jgi:ABC-type branched-subunit amino acid transport system ATPase component
MRQGWKPLNLEVVGRAGPNGASETTLLNVVELTTLEGVRP